MDSTYDDCHLYPDTHTEDDHKREPAQPVPLRDCGHAAWTCACRKFEPATRDEDPADIQHEPVIQEGY